MAATLFKSRTGALALHVPLFRPPVHRQPCDESKCVTRGIFEQNIQQGAANTDHSYDEHPHRVASSGDLLLDLLVVAALAKLSESLELTNEVFGFGQGVQDLFALFIPVYAQWWKTVRLLNLFDSEDIIFLFIFFANLIGLAAIVLPLDACSTDWVERDCPKFTAALAATRFFHCFVALYAIYFNPPISRPLLVETSVDFIVAIFWTLDSFFAHDPWSIFLLLWWLPMAIDIVAPFVFAVFAYQKRFYFHRVTIDLHLQTERLSLFLLLCMGEVVVSATSNLVADALDESRPKFSNNDQGALFTYPYFVTFGFILIVFGLKLFYFDMRNVVEPRTCGPNDSTHAMARSPLHGYIWEVLHVPLYLSVILIGASTRVFIREGLFSHQVLAWAIAVAVFVISIQQAISRGARHKVKRNLNSVQRSAIRFCSIITCILVGALWPRSGEARHDEPYHPTESPPCNNHTHSGRKEPTYSSDDQLFIGTMVIALWTPLLLELWGRQIHSSEYSAFTNENLIQHSEDSDYLEDSAEDGGGEGGHSNDLTQPPQPIHYTLFQDLHHDDIQTTNRANSDVKATSSQLEQTQLI
eukprot:gene6384-9304_t